jgi:hypothetical protein
MAGAFTEGLKKGGAMIGLPFWISSGLFLGILAALSVSGFKEKNAVEIGGHGDDVGEGTEEIEAS